MTDTYINLVNRVLKPFNEVKLTEGNFSTVVDGFHQHAKDAINDAIYDICIYEDTLYPFLWTAGTITTATDGTLIYTLNASAANVEWESFRVLRNDSLLITPNKINELDYDIYRKTLWEQDAASNSDSYGPPRTLVRTPDNKAIISPPSDRAYTIEYEYYVMPNRLVNSTDTTIIPLAYNQIIIDKALQYLHMFRGDYEASQLCSVRFENNLANMKRILIRRSNTMVAL